jgi:hypothetical protein
MEGRRENVMLRRSTLSLVFTEARFVRWTRTAATSVAADLVETCRLHWQRAAVIPLPLPAQRMKHHSR